MKTWKKAVKEYYRFHKMGRNDFTYRKYFDPILEDKDINTISKQDIAKIKSGIKGKPSTVNRYLRVISSGTFSNCSFNVVVKRGTANDI